MKILAEIATKDREFLTLPLTIQSIINQTRKPDGLVIIDDGKHIDLRGEQLYVHLFNRLSEVGISCVILYGKRLGQHYSHQMAQEYAIENGYDLIWRIDDDEVAEKNVLETLEKTLTEKEAVAVGGLVMSPGAKSVGRDLDARMLKIENINLYSNIQWLKHTKNEIIEVEHLYSSFLYKVGLHSYNLKLSPVAHREETLFSVGLAKHGKLLVDTSVITWHYRETKGGIRSHNDQSFYQKDEELFNLYVKYGGKRIAFLDSGAGDHIVFLKALEDKLSDNIDVIACCYPWVFEKCGKEIISLEEGKRLVDSSKFNLYKYMIESKDKMSLYDAYPKMYANIDTVIR